MNPLLLKKLHTKIGVAFLYGSLKTQSRSFVLYTSTKDASLCFNCLLLGRMVMLYAQEASLIAFLYNFSPFRSFSTKYVQYNGSHAFLGALECHLTERFPFFKNLHNLFGKKICISVPYLRIIRLQKIAKTIEEQYSIVLENNNLLFLKK